MQSAILTKMDIASHALWRWFFINGGGCRVMLSAIPIALSHTLPYIRHNSWYLLSIIALILPSRKRIKALEIETGTNQELGKGILGISTWNFKVICGDIIVKFSREGNISANEILDT